MKPGAIENEEDRPYGWRLKPLSRERSEVDISLALPTVELYLGPIQRPRFLLSETDRTLLMLSLRSATLTNNEW